MDTGEEVEGHQDQTRKGGKNSFFGGLANVFRAAKAAKKNKTKRG